MRIREITFHDFRSFRGRRRVSFVDPLTDAVRPINVLAGTNGTGKTTILDTIEALLAFALDPDQPRDLVREAMETGLIHMIVEVDLPAANGQITAPASQMPSILHIAVGRKELVRGMPEREWLNLVCWLVQRGKQGPPFRRQSRLAKQFREQVSGMLQGQTPLEGGLLYFPHDRRLTVTDKGGPIEPPSEQRSWLFRHTASDQWPGSLEQLWVWQNYLDLERGAQGHTSLEPFVESVETILGSDRTIQVSEGRAQIRPAWRDGEKDEDWLRLNQLPSGEQQVLLLFGELARRRRGAVLAIDEPEISLHPTLQRQVVHQLRQFARTWDMQVILATHSLEVLRAVHESERILLDQLDQAEGAEAPVLMARLHCKQIGDLPC